MAVGRCFRVYHKHIQGQPYSIILENTRHPTEFLLLESGVAATLESNDRDEFRRQYTKLLDGYGCLGILQLTGGEVTKQYLCMVTGCTNVGRLADCDVYRITGVTFLSMWAPHPAGSSAAQTDERINEIQKLVSSNVFYFAWSTKEGSAMDLSLCSQKRYTNPQHSTVDTSDNRFFWNRTLHLPLSRYGINTRDWLLCCMCGGVEIKTVYVGAQQAKSVLISRLSCERMGTRFYVRGVNDDGHVANFVETEQVIFLEDIVTSYVQTRGSIPLFWEQPGVQVGAHKVKLSRGFEASAPAYDRHFKLLKHYYGDQVIVNLLGNKEGERILGQAFKTHHEASSHADSIDYVPFDYHALVRVGNKVGNMDLLWNKVREKIHQFGFFHAQGDTVLRQQTGTMRTNCLDCLDRTNCVQTYFGLAVLEGQLGAMQLTSKPNIRGRFQETYKTIWQSNGDQCSRIYAGTGALEGKSKIKDGARSVTRTIQNNLMDGSKQEAMDLFLMGTGLNCELYDRASALLPVNLLQASPNVLSAMVERQNEYTLPQTLRIFCGTWNVNGGTRFDSVAFRGQQALSDWLLDLPEKATNGKLVNVAHDFTAPIDIFAIGLEEIVDLNASNIMSASTTNQKKWAEAIKACISGRNQKYILMHSLQLVGVCLFVFIRPHLAPYLRDLAVDSVKCGLGGTTGNKGGVAVRFRLHSTTLCFVCSHFAAGQKQIAERNADYAEQTRRIQFPMGRNIMSHDYVFWLGDFNYRVDLKGNEVKELVRQGNYAPLIEKDQLTIEKEAGKTFNEFFEGPLTFAPTYKYDNFSDDYDTSEKCRTPAYTDRILWRQRPQFGQPPLETPSEQCQLLFYGRAELKTSDHRPVGGLWDLEVREVDVRKREAVFKEVVGCMGPPDGTVLVTVPGRQQEQEEFPKDMVDGIWAKVNDELGARILLYKFVGSELWLIFKDGEMALAALSMDGCVINGHPVKVALRSANWEAEMEKELEDSKWMGIDTSYTLLAEDSRQDFDFEGDDVEPELMAVNSTGKLGSSPRSASPATTTGWSGSSTPIGDELPAANGNAKKGPPPPRPAPPPKRPPPPTSAAGGRPKPPAIPAAPVISKAYDPMSAINAAWNEEHVVLRSDTGHTPTDRPVTLPPQQYDGVLPHGLIGQPTNIVHQGARSHEEAKALISQLYQTQLSNPSHQQSSTAMISSTTNFPGDDDSGGGGGGGWGDFANNRASAVVGNSQFFTSSNNTVGVNPAANVVDPFSTGTVADPFQSSANNNSNSIDPFSTTAAISHPDGGSAANDPFQTTTNSTSATNPTTISATATAAYSTTPPNPVTDPFRVAPAESYVPPTQPPPPLPFSEPPPPLPSVSNDPSAAWGAPPAPPPRSSKSPDDPPPSLPRPPVAAPRGSPLHQHHHQPPTGAVPSIPSRPLAVAAGGAPPPIPARRAPPPLPPK